ncbi:clotting factor B [Caerostris extrusa]|uniref:Clotting factor B n=1 Tax=Caerostris extrusa TaxID=172846 RepID=A0AAV4QSW3_CAEEX|nr:clotting factor B [Caerostris extrusa]
MGTDILQRGDGLTIFPPNECRDIMSKIAGKQLPDNFGDYYICAGVPDGSRDACIGDSGGPLLHEDYDGMWSLVGVVSFGYKCAEPGVPGTYSRISYYIPWIIKTLETPDSVKEQPFLFISIYLYYFLVNEFCLKTLNFWMFLNQ